MANQQEQIAAITQEVFGDNAGRPAQSRSALTVETLAEEGARPEELDTEVLESTGADQAPDVAETQPDDGDGREITSFGDLVRELEAAGWDPQDVYSLDVVLDDGGPDKEPTRVPLGEIKDRLQQAARSESEISEQRIALNQQAQAFAARVEQFTRAAQEISDVEQQAISAVQEIQAAFNIEPWETMEPAAKIERENQYKQAYATAKQRLDQVMAHGQQFRAQAQESLRAQHNAKLLNEVPAWRDPKVAQQEGTATGQYMMTRFGYTPDEIAGKLDWRDRLAYHQSRLWEEHQRKVATIGETVKKTGPRTMPPGKGGARRQLSNARADELVRKARQSRRREDQLAAGLAVLDAHGVKLR